MPNTPDNPGLTPGKGYYSYDLGSWHIVALNSNCNKVGGCKKTSAQGKWLRNIEVEGSLDYVATGLPRAGERIGNELFLTKASPWSFSLVFVIPLAPLRP